MLGLAVALATVGVVVSIVVVALVAHLLLGLDWRTALLIGAVLSLHRRGGRLLRPCAGCALPPRLVATLEAESGMNDAPGGAAGDPAVGRDRASQARGGRSC